MQIDSKMLLAIIPLALINVSLIIWCLTDWFKREKFKYLPKLAWLFIVLFIQFIGPVTYLTLGRNHDSHTD